MERLNGGAEWLPEEISQVIGWAVVVKSSTDGEYWTEVEPVIEFAYEVRTMTDVRREYEDPLLFRWQLRLAEADG